MTGVHIRVRVTNKGKRYDVRYRRGGRGWSLEHGGTFTSRKHAELRRDLIAGWLAVGKDPRRELATLIAQPEARTFRHAATAYAESRVDLADESRRATRSHLNALNALIGDVRLDDITTDLLQDRAIGGLAARMRASSVSRYVVTLVLILDHARVTPNPARGLRLPKPKKKDMRVPTARQIERMLEHVRPRWRLPIRVLAATGARVGELERWTWGDVDLGSGRILNREGKTAAARRWVAVPADLLDEVAETCPLEDRVAERPLFMGFNADGARGAMRRACVYSGVPHMTPHDLRHRYVSVQLARGVPVANVGEQVGHSRLAETFNTYTHVVLEDE